MKPPIQSILKQCDIALEEYRKLDSQDGVKHSETVRVYAKLTDIVFRFSPQNSQYRKTCDSTSGKTDPYDWNKLEVAAGVVAALRDAYADGFLDDVQELIHGEMFSDYIDMAVYLLEEGYKDAAAVITGGTLEQHLRQLSTKSSLPILDSKNNKPLKADFLNNELVRAGVYQKGEQKSVTAWLDLRNNAAHADYDSYQAKDVDLMIQGIRNFINQNPA